MVNEVFDEALFRNAAVRAITPAARFLRTAIIGGIDLREYQVKSDDTNVTIADRESQRISRPILRSLLPDCLLTQEESNAPDGNLDSDIEILHDPLDGTGGFLIGGNTPTIILAAYDRRNKEVLACATMEPTTGRLWYSARGGGASVATFDYGLHA